MQQSRPDPFLLRLVLALALLSSAGGRMAGAQVDRDAPEHWRPVDPENLLVIHLESGDVFLELAPQFAPQHVDQMRRLARAAYFDEGASFYRVIDNFVAQGGVFRGDESDDGDDGGDASGEDSIRAESLPAEFERPLGDLVFVPNGSPDLYAPETGHIDGFAVGHDPAIGTVWPLHCYGVVGMARGNDPNSGSAHFYIINGRDQRYLDRNLTVFGRVVAGMDVIQRVARGERAVGNGVIPNPEDRTPIIGMSIASDLSESDQPHVEIMRSESPAFAAEKDAKYYRDNDFFPRKPEVVEACAVTGPVRLTNDE